MVLFRVSLATFGGIVAITALVLAATALGPRIGTGHMIARIRISLASLLGMAAVAAFGLAGITSASSVWAGAAAITVLVVLLSAVLASWFLPGPSRQFWAGFAL